MSQKNLYQSYWEVSFSLKALTISTVYRKFTYDVTEDFKVDSSEGSRSWSHLRRMMLCYRLKGLKIIVYVNHKEKHAKAA